MAPPVLRCDCNPGNYRVINCRVSIGVRGAGQRTLCGIRGVQAHSVSRNFPDYSFALDTALYQRRHFRLSAP